MRKANLYQVGVTEDGMKVYAGVYNFYSECGLPLDVLLNLSIEQKWVPCWTSFYLEAEAAGMKHDRIIAKIEEAILDSYNAQNF